MPKQFNYDRFKSVNPRESAVCAMAVLDALQKFPAEVQAAGLTVAFANLVDHYGLHEGTMHQVARNLLARERQSTPELRAVELYTRNEL